MEKTATKNPKIMNLIIVESPTKAKTISGMLKNENYKIESSFGHIRDLPKSRLGIDIEKNFEPQYIIPVKSKKTVSNLRHLAEKAEKIILATDLDREGEAIAWHLEQSILAKNTKPKKSKKTEPKSSDNALSPIFERIVFHEITKKAIEEALQKPKKINIDLVNAQQARRVLDRLVGYKLSPFLWNKIMSKLSAGRVQSAALRIIVDREREIEIFKPQKYWSIQAEVKKENDSQKFISYLIADNKNPIEKPGILQKETAEKILSDVKKSSWKIGEVSKKDKIKRPHPPFTTSSLQQAAWNSFKFSAKKTMVIAQQLYEGIEIKEKERAGLITYMRTDSLNLSEDSLSEAKQYLTENLGKPYSLETPRRFKTKTKGAQEAHEAIRPTDINLTPEKISKSLTPEQLKIYRIIWQRFLASQMPDAVFNETVVKIIAAAENKEYLFESKGLTMKFDGFLKVYPSKIEEEILPELTEKDKIEFLSAEMKEHETNPPPRYNEASLIKTLEKFGVGRPSTYAPIISAIQERGYVIKNSNKSLEPTEIGLKVTDLLKEHFSDIVDINFTAKMEKDLDKIAEGKKKWQSVIKEFYEPFNKNLEEKYEKVEKQKITEETDEKCELCGKNLVIKMGRFGKFMACSGFPECKFSKSLPKPSLNIKCPKCADGEVVERKTKKGRRVFYGCSKYPDCDFNSWEKPKEQIKI